MGIGNDLLLILLLSILSTPANEEGEVEFASNTNFLLLLLLVLNNTRTIENLCNYGTCYPNQCPNNNGCAACNRLLNL